jgi:hypothetical protein
MPMTSSLLDHHVPELGLLHDLLVHRSSNSVAGLHLGGGGWRNPSLCPTSHPLQIIKANEASTEPIEDLRGRHARGGLGALDRP